MTGMTGILTHSMDLFGRKAGPSWNQKSQWKVYAEGTKSNYSDSDFHFSKPLDYTYHHNGTGVAERNGQAHWDDTKVLKKIMKF